MWTYFSTTCQCNVCVFCGHYRPAHLRERKWEREFCRIDKWVIGLTKSPTRPCHVSTILTRCTVRLYLYTISESDVRIAFTVERRESYTRFITAASWHIAWKKFCEDTPVTPTSPEVTRAHTLNFRSNFKFSGLNFFKGTPIPSVVCASKSWSICNVCKNLRGQHPPKAEM